MNLLTEEEIRTIWSKSGAWSFDFARAIEAAVLFKIAKADVEPACNPHPDAPHGFDRNGSHNAGRYVCECEGWTAPEKVDVEPVAEVAGRWGNLHIKFLDAGIDLELGDKLYSASALAALRQENERLKYAFDEWMDKTAWTVKKVQPKELGMHRADIARQRFEAERADNKRLRKALETARLRLKVGMPEYDASDVLDAIEDALDGEQK